jgi:hypothetical protein
MALGVFSAKKYFSAETLAKLGLWQRIVFGRRSSRSLGDFSEKSGFDKKWRY